MQSVPSDRSPSRGRSGPHLPPSPTLHHQSVLAHVAGEVSLQRTALALNLLHHRQVCLSHLSPPLLSNRIDRTRGNEWPPIATRSSRGKCTRWNSRQYLKQKAHASPLPIRSDRSEGSLRSSQRWKAEKQPGPISMRWSRGQSATRKLAPRQALESSRKLCGETERERRWGRPRSVKEWVRRKLSFPMATERRLIRKERSSVGRRASLQQRSPMESSSVWEVRRRLRGGGMSDRLE